MKPGVLVSSVRVNRSVGGWTLVVALPAPAAKIVPEGPGGVIWTEEGTHKGCPYGFEIEARPVTNTCIR